MSEPTAAPLRKDLAYQQLKLLLSTGRLESGQALSERQAALRLGLGLAPTRSAIERLKAEGLLLDSPNTGLVVPELSISTVLDFYETRMVLERHIVQSVAGRVSDELLARLRRALDEQDECARAGDATLFQRLDMEFHLELATCHGNQEMVRVLERLRDRMDRFVHQIVGRHPERIAVSAGQHRDIVAALGVGDGAEAVRRLEGHLRWGRDLMFARD